MQSISYARHQFPAEIIQHAVWLYLRFTLSYRDVEELLAERGIVVSHETVRRWVLTFGPAIARRLRARRPKPHSRWHLDEMCVRVGGKQMYLWRGLSMRKARSWTCSSRPSATRRPLVSSCASC
jgi:putative transposase